MTNPDDEAPRVLEEPMGDDLLRDEDDQTPWMRGLWMLLFALFFELSKTILGVIAVLQFLWLLFGKARNDHLAGFGEDLADWQARVARFLSCASEDRPFPFAPWGKEG